jgi:hypothetical protein
VAGYINFLERAVQGQRAPVADLVLDYSNEIAIAQDAAQLLDRLDLLLTGRQLSTSVRDAVRTAMESVTVTATSSNEVKLQRVRIGVMLILASTDYLIQK